MYQAPRAPSLSCIAQPTLKETAMHIMRSSRVLVATFVVAGLTASPALASGGPIDRRSPDAKDAAAALTAAKTIDRRSPDVQDMASRPDTAGNSNVTARKDLRTTASLSGPPPGATGIYVPPAEPAGKAPLPGPPQFPTNTVPLAPPVEPVSPPPAGDSFDVGDAVIGAGGAAVLLAAVAGGLAMSRRRRIATAA
jgi:hypothetical protein